MNKTLKAVKLDYITVSPYFTLKNLLLFSFVFLFLGYFTDNPVMVMGMLMMYGMMFASYPFAVGDKNGIDTLYCTLPLGRAQVVAGRYLFALSLVAVSGLIAFLSNFLASAVLGRELVPASSALTLLVVFGVYTLLLFIQLPIYFRLGYAKAKFLAYVPLMGFAAASALAARLFFEKTMPPRVAAFLESLAEIPGVLIAAAALFWLLTLAVSLALSLRFYKRREF